MIIDNEQWETWADDPPTRFGAVLPPVPELARVRVQYRYGALSRFRLATSVRWWWASGERARPKDIIAYREEDQDDRDYNRQ